MKKKMKKIKFNLLIESKSKNKRKLSKNKNFLF